MRRSAFVKINELAKARVYFSLTKEQSEGVTLAPSYLCVGLPIRTVLDKDGEAVDRTSLKAGQRVTLSSGVDIFNDRYNVILSVHPDLLKAGQVSGPASGGFLDVGEKREASVTFTPYKTTDVSSLTYLVRVALID